MLQIQKSQLQTETLERTLNETETAWTPLLTHQNCFTTFTSYRADFNNFMSHKQQQHQACPSCVHHFLPSLGNSVCHHLYISAYGCFLYFVFCLFVCFSSVSVEVSGPAFILCVCVCRDVPSHILVCSRPLQCVHVVWTGHFVTVG